MTFDRRPVRQTGAQAVKLTLLLSIYALAVITKTADSGPARRTGGRAIAVGRTPPSNQSNTLATGKPAQPRQSPIPTAPKIHGPDYIDKSRLTVE
jgi:hypothetical protein